MTSARDLTLKLGGVWRNGSGTCRCPVHEDRSPSLSIKDGAGGAALLVHCFAGCSWQAVKDELVRRGLIDCARGRTTKATRSPERFPKFERGEPAHRIWHRAQEAPGTLAEVYLRARGLTTTPPPVLRFQWLKHTPSNTVHPCMIALVQHGSTGESIAIHRTYLRKDGAAKADIDPAKMMLGRCAGGAVRLAAPTGILMIGEGIETVLSAMQASGNPGWAALSTSGMRNLQLPIDVRNIVILADADEPGIAAAQFAARRWHREGRAARIARPPNGAKDFNDALLMEQAQ